VSGVVFQSTCLREARRVRSASPGRLENFNPRAYVRHDLIRSLGYPIYAFQSTCLREARPTTTRIVAGPRSFQSTCLREARLRNRPGFLFLDISIHVPT